MGKRSLSEARDRYKARDRQGILRGHWGGDSVMLGGYWGGDSVMLGGCWGADSVTAILTAVLACYRAFIEYY